MQASQKLVTSFAFPVAALITVFNLLTSVSSSEEDTIIESNEYKVQEFQITPPLLFEIKVHGFLLWASVGFLIPVAILIKRVSIREQSGKRLRIIFYIHAIAEVIAVLFATSGAVLSIKYFDNSFSNDHQRIGLAFYVLMWLQAFVAIFIRPHRGSKNRSIWFLCHWLVGIAVSLLGVINIYTGLQAYHRRTSRNVRLWTILFTVQISIISLIYLLQEKWQYIQKQGAILGNRPVQPTDQEMSPRREQKETSSEPC